MDNIISVEHNQIGTRLRKRVEREEQGESRENLEGENINLFNIRVLNITVHNPPLYM